MELFDLAHSLHEDRLREAMTRQLHQQRELKAVRKKRFVIPNNIATYLVSVLHARNLRIRPRRQAQSASTKVYAVRCTQSD
jgi:hypothetical protein